MEHARHSGRDERLAQLHIRAGQELLAVYDLKRALWHFERAIARTGDRPLRVDALEGKADVALLQGNVAAALHDYLETLTVDANPLRALQIAAKAVHAFYRKSIVHLNRGGDDSFDSIMITGNFASANTYTWTYTARSGSTPAKIAKGW